MDDARIRASDADRDHVVAALRQEVGTGRLTLDEFDERAAAAYRARTLGDLAEVTHDLPAATPPPVTASHRVLVPVLVLVALLAGGLLVLAVPATAGGMSQMMAQMGSMCG